MWSALLWTSCVDLLRLAQRLPNYLEKLEILNVVVIPRLVTLQKMQNKLQIVVGVTGWGFLTCLNNLMFSFLTFSDYRAVVGCSCGLVLPTLAANRPCRARVLCHMCDLCSLWGMDAGLAVMEEPGRLSSVPSVPSLVCDQGMLALQCCTRICFCTGFAPARVYITAQLCWAWGKGDAGGQTVRALLVQVWTGWTWWSQGSVHKVCRLPLQTLLLCDVWAGIHVVTGKALTLRGARGWIQVWALVLLPPAPQIGYVWNGERELQGREHGWCVSSSLFLLLAFLLPSCQILPFPT